jgi:hypothetical protein
MSGKATKKNPLKRVYHKKTKTLKNSKNNNTTGKYVFHGSPSDFVIAKPSYTRRSKMIDGKLEIVFEGTTLHATPYKWIALYYLHNKMQNLEFINNGKKYYYSTGVSLFNNNKKVMIFGQKNLEYSLKKIYGKGGYLYIFEEKNFTTAKGLGNLEVISYEPQKPIKKIFIKNPVKEMKKLGVIFDFKDITKK